MGTTQELSPGVVFSPDAESALLTVNSLYANRFNLAMTPEVARLSFGEQITQDLFKYHTAISMSWEGLEKLQQVIAAAIEKRPQAAK